MTRRRTRSSRPHAARATASPGAPGVAPVGGSGVARTSNDAEALRVTHWFESGSSGPAYSTAVRFRGRLARPSGGASSGRRQFVHDETIDGIVPGTGPVSITAQVYNLAPGEWTVTAELLASGRRARSQGESPGTKSSGKTLPRAAWSWRRWTLTSGSFTPVRTRWAPLVRLEPAPAVIPGTWSGLVTLGFVVGVALQGLLLSRAGIPVLPSLVLTTLAALAGLGGAKLRYIAMHRRTWRDSPGEGWAVDGFLVVLPLVVAAGLLLLELPIGRFLDSSTPALFMGIAIGRVGCFLTGCCAGRCTRSRWGVWSSDRRVGARRVPTQLLESGAALILGVLTLGMLFAVRPPVDGLVFVVAITAYTLVRRVLLRLRAARQAPVDAHVTPALRRDPEAMR
jgi:phosphatidylglycerol:prolipoprotein diacylglycerol transferase